MLCLQVRVWPRFKISGEGPSVGHDGTLITLRGGAGTASADGAAVLSAVATTTAATATTSC